MKKSSLTKECEMLINMINIFMNHGLSLEQSMDILREMSELMKGD